MQVQNAYAQTSAKIFFEQILAHRALEAQARASANRGGAGEDAPGDTPKKAGSSSKGVAPPTPISSKLKIFLGASKKIVEGYDFQAVVEGIIKQIFKSNTPNGNLRAGYVAVLAYLLRDCVSGGTGAGEGETGLSNADFEWVVPQLLSILHAPEELQQSSYEDLALFRTRLSHLIRFSITANSSESVQKALASCLLHFVSNMANRSEGEIQLALTELAHVCT